MARPIRNTPILMGRDADRFLHEISVLPSAEERRKERARIQESAQQFLSLVMNVKKRQEACEYIETINSKPPYLVDMVSDFGPFVFTSVFIVLMNVN